MTEKMPEVVWLRSRRDTAWWWSWYEEKQGADDIPYVPESRVDEAMLAAYRDVEACSTGLDPDLDKIVKSRIAALEKENTDGG